MITVHDQWAMPMATDCAAARLSITASALSLHALRRPSETPFGHLWAAWQCAAARGCTVDFFLAAPSKNHPATAQNLTAGGILRSAGMRAHFVPQPRLLHAKTLIIDARIVWIGSGNFTAAAAHHNHEIYCRFESPEIAQRIAARWQSIEGVHHENF